jgi:hypothetical protein
VANLLAPRPLDGRRSIVAADIFWQQLLRLAFAFVVSLFVVNVGYGFEGTGKEPVFRNVL